MNAFWVDARSTIKGIRHMRLIGNNASWSIKLLPKRFWLHLWTPKWHNGNGPYLTLGLWIIAIYRGY